MPNFSPDCFTILLLSLEFSELCLQRKSLQAGVRLCKIERKAGLMLGKVPAVALQNKLIELRFQS